MPTLPEALARLREFRRSWPDDAEIDEESGLTAADLDAILEGMVLVRDGGVTR